MANDTEDDSDGPRRRGPGRPFPAGTSGNPAGRPKGARNRLGEAFLDDLRALWETDGEACLREALREKPMEFAKMVAGLLPKELLVGSAPEEDMSDAELADTIESLRAVARRH